VTIDEMTAGDISDAIGTPVVSPEDSLALALHSHAGGSDGPS
jgi:hypothetical protein